MKNRFLTTARILIVDDEAANVRLLEIILQQAGFTNLCSSTDARQVSSLYDSFQPDALLLDLMMPWLNGFEVMEQILAKTPPGSYQPILVMTADTTAAVREKALSSGAKDFLTKPFDATEILLRLNNLLEVRVQRLVLEHTVRERTEDIEAAHRETMHRLARAAEYRDDDTGQHTRRVGQMAAGLAGELGLPYTQVALFEEAAALHDVGKIAIPDAILLKPGKLTPDEFEIIKTHTVIGEQILAGSSSRSLQLAAQIALTHHERWDGSGYAGLKAQEIPLSGRIVAVADVFDALTHERPYKKAWSLEAATAEIKDQSGRQFDPRVVQAFFELKQKLSKAMAA
jgi:putative two-component system response regulator